MPMEQNFHTKLVFLIFVTFFNRTTSEFQLKLIPWDSPDSPLYPGNLTPLQKYIRITTHAQKLESIFNNDSNSMMDSKQLQLPVQSQENYRYAVDFKIGTPPKKVKLLVDTGAGFVWTECDSTSYEIYNPKRSTTYQKQPCNHPLCAKKICKCVKKQCVCKIPFGTNAFGSRGKEHTVAGSIDKFQLPSSKKPASNLIFGCSKYPPLNLSGILGLDRTPASLVRQLKGESKGRFSYCLHNGDSYLTLGGDISPAAKSTPLIHTEYSALLLNLIDISVNGHRLGLPPSLFSLKNGGVFMDTGMQYTVLTQKAYDKVNRAIEQHFKGKLKKTIQRRWNLRRCYNLTPGFDDYPEFAFHFEGADLEVKYTHVADHNEGIVCTALLPGKTTVIGALQQWNTRFMFDINKNVLKFHQDDDCLH